MRPQAASKHARLISLLIGAVALLACLWLGRNAVRQALLSYLFAFVFFTGLSIGSLALALVPALTGGEWGRIARPQLKAAIQMLPLQALFSLPLLIGIRVIYPWADPLVLAQDAQLRAQSWYLDPTFFIIRSAIYFGVWFWLGATFRRRAGRPERLSRIAAPGLIAYGITATLASIDWIMSLFPHWHSTIFGLLAAVGWVLASAALAMIVALYAMPRNAKIQPGLTGLANLLLALVLAWAYLAFMQYLTVWIADLPAETSWYIPRTLTSWRFWAWFLIAFHFAVPFFILLSRRAKQSRPFLLLAASMLLLASLADALWLVIPGFRPAGLALRWTDLLAPVGMGALWGSFYLGQLRGRVHA